MNHVAVTATSATCSRCEQELDVALFAKDASRKSGRKSWCRACDARRCREAYQAKAGRPPRAYTRGGSKRTKPSCMRCGCDVASGRLCDKCSRTCTTCGQEITPETAVKDASRASGFHQRCRPCNQERCKKYSAAARPPCACGAPRGAGKRRRCDACHAAHREQAAADRAASRPRPEQEPKPCATCDQAFTPSSHNQRYCGKGCRPVNPSGYKRKPAPSAVQRTCAHCDRVFFQPGNRKPAEYCRQRCRKSASKARRRALIAKARVEPVSRAKVLARDRWTCQLCGEQIPRHLLVPHDLAATLDHIVPLSLGGEHSEANLQAAHFICNSRKGASAPVVGETATMGGHGSREKIAGLHTTPPRCSSLSDEIWLRAGEAG